MAYLGLLVYLFFFFIRLQDWWDPLYAAPVDYIIISFIFVTLLPQFSKCLNILKMPQSKFFLLFVATVFLSNIAVGQVDGAIEQAIKYLKFAIIFFAIALSVDSFKKLKWLAFYIVLLISFIAYQAVIQAKTGTNWAGQSLYWADRIRWVGLFDGSNITALAFVITVPFLLEYLFSSVRYKIFSLASGGLILTGFYLANSRGGFLSLVAVIFGFMLTRIKKKKGVIVGVLLVFVLFAFAAPSRMGEIDDSSKSTRGRIHEWEEALEMVRYENPLLGIGKGQWTNYTSLKAHNAFLQQLGETGLIGAFFWVGMVYATIVGAFRVYKKENLAPPNRSLYMGYFLAFLGLLVGAFFISADNELLYIWMAILTAITIIENIDMRFSIRELKVIGMVELAGVTATYFAVNLFKMIYF
jgi:O-antigen ligase